VPLADQGQTGAKMALRALQNDKPVFHFRAGDDWMFA